MTRTRTSWLHSAALGGATGALIGGMEALLILAQIPWRLYEWSVLGIAMGWSGLIGGLVAALGWLAACRWSPSSLQDERSWSLRVVVWTLLSTLYWMAGFHINYHLFPGLTSRSSLAFSFGWTALWLVGGWWCLRSRRLARVRLPGVIERGLIRGLGLAVVVWVIGLGWTRLPFAHGRTIEASGRAPQPHIVLVVMDTTRPDHLSVYGYARRTSPQLEALAQQAAVFEQAFAAGAWTVPTHAAIFTGLMPRQHGADWGHELLEDQVTTIAERLQERGYQTIGLCKNPWISRATGFAQGFEIFEEMWRGGRAAHRLTAARLADKIRELVWQQHDDDADKIVADVRSWLAQRDRARPLFLFVNLLEPHMVYEPPAPFNRRFSQGLPPSTLRRQYQAPFRRRVPPVEMSEADRAVLTALYDGEIAYVDARVGELMDGLRDAGVLDEALCIVTADHGENIGDHAMTEHQFCLYDTLVHVPLIVRFPEGIAAGTRIAQPVETRDIFPTILEAVRRPVETDAQTPDTVSLYRAVDGAAAPSSRAVMAEYAAPIPLLKRLGHDPSQSPWARSLRVYREGPWKYIWASDGRHELYDVASDPLETQNRMTAEPARARAMQAALARWVESTPPLTPMATPQMDAVQKARLQGLGYLQ